MKQRCHNPSNDRYADYGGRGIYVYGAWRGDYDVFADYVLRVLGNRPPNTSIDRIDNSKGYQPGNIRWATQAVQMRNTRANVEVKWGGTWWNAAALSELFNVRYSLFKSRIDKGWTVADALKCPDHGDRPEILMDRRYAPSYTPQHRVSRDGFETVGPLGLHGYSEEPSERWLEQTRRLMAEDRKLPSKT